MLPQKYSTTPVLVQVRVFEVIHFQPIYVQYSYFVRVLYKQYRQYFFRKEILVLRRVGSLVVDRIQEASIASTSGNCRVSSITCTSTEYDRNNTVRKSETCFKNYYLVHVQVLQKRHEQTVFLLSHWFKNRLCTCTDVCFGIIKQYCLLFYSLINMTHNGSNTSHLNFTIVLFLGLMTHDVKCSSNRWEIKFCDIFESEIPISRCQNM